jgi:hypothetical protein
MIRVTKEAPFGVLFCSRELLQTHGIYRTSVDGCWKRPKFHIAELPRCSFE